MMDAKSKRPLFVSICGLDGVGKTTVIRTLAEQHCDNRYYFVGRGPAECERAVERTIPRVYRDWRDWIQGPHAQALAVACAFDYLAYFNRVIAPLFRSGLERFHGLLAPSVVLTDRHALCFEAYARCNGQPNELALQLLGSVPRPDLVFYLTLPPALIEARRSEGDVQDEFEHPQAQARQAAAYEEVLRELSCPVIRIDNSASLAQTCATIKVHVEDALCAHAA